VMGTLFAIVTVYVLGMAGFWEAIRDRIRRTR
jgi:hypothetical protein